MNFLNTFIYSNKPGIRFLRHFLFWTTDAANYLLVISVNTQITTDLIYRLVFAIPSVALVTYFILYFILPQLSKKPNKLKLVLWFIGVFVYIGYGVRYYTYYFIKPTFDPNFVLPADIWDFRRVLGEVFSWASVICMAIAIKLIKNRTELQQKNEQLTEEKKIAELSFLKSQMHPHFLFNTLNTLYSDTIRETGKGEEIVLRLSSLMRFILEECSKPMIALEKEIKVIEDYIALESLRHGSRLKIDFKEAIRDKSKLISPLLLLPFIENSCKHTLSSIRGPILITIELKSENGFVSLFVENELVDRMKKNGVNHGLGISNVKRQLSLLYDSKFTLEVIKVNGKYSVNLKVPVLTQNGKDTVHYH